MRIQLNSWTFMGTTMWTVQASSDALGHPEVKLAWSGSYETGCDDYLDATWELVEQVSDALQAFSKQP